MDFRLAKEIYGKPWYVDALTIQSLSVSLSNARTSETFSKKLNQSKKIKCDSESGVGTECISQVGINVICLDGPITKNGGESHVGTSEIAEELIEADQSDEIIGHIFQIDSGGGSADAVRILTDAMKECTKPIVTFCNGTMASAALYIGSYADYIYSEYEENEIGSIGTMIELAGYPKVSEDDSDGFKRVRIYADQSTKKNYEFEEALNSLNFQPIKDKMLNPFNERFINDMKMNRPNIRQNELTGEIFYAKDVVGSLIDEIGSFENAMQKVIALHNQNKPLTNRINQINMNINQLKQEHPDIFAESVQIGINQERERVQSIIEFNSIDPDGVSELIKNGGVVNATVISQMSKKAIEQAQLKLIEQNSPDAVNPIDENPKTEKELELEKVKNEVFNFLNIK